MDIMAELSATEMQSKMHDIHTPWHQKFSIARCFFQNYLALKPEQGLWEWVWHHTWRRNPVLLQQDSLWTFLHDLLLWTKEMHSNHTVRPQIVQVFTDTLKIASGSITNLPSSTVTLMCTCWGLLLPLTHPVFEDLAILSEVIGQLFLNSLQIKTECSVNLHNICNICLSVFTGLLQVLKLNPNAKKVFVSLTDKLLKSLFSIRYIIAHSSHVVEKMSGLSLVTEQVLVVVEQLLVATLFHGEHVALYHDATWCELPLDDAGKDVALKSSTKNQQTNYVSQLFTQLASLRGKRWHLLYVCVKRGICVCFPVNTCLLLLFIKIPVRYF